MTFKTGIAAAEFRQGIGSKALALGHLKPGERNKTEAAYEAYLGMLQRAGDIQRFWFQSIKLRLADNTFLTPDFNVLAADGVLEMHDTKGSPALITDKAHVKMKVAAEIHPFRFFYVFPRGRLGSGAWDLRPV